MEKLSVCRVCLGEDVRLHSIVGTHLQEMYESLVLVTLEITDGRPVLACYICWARLKNCYELRKSCLQSEALFSQMLSSNELEQVKLQGVNNKMRLTTDNVVHLSVGHALDTSADNVGGETVKCEVKLESTGGEDIDEDALEENSVFDNVQSAGSGEDFVINIKEEQTGNITIDPTPKASTQDDQKNPEYLTSSSLKYHVLVQDPLQDLLLENSSHTAQKPHQCNMCHKSFSRIQYLASHMRIHTRDKPYHCVSCSKRFSLKEHLIIHMRKHTNEKPYHCHLCNKRFTSNSQLRKHLRTHTGEKPHYCDMCKKNFSQKSNLIRHMRTHSGEKLFHCDICKKQFTRKHTLIYHMRTHTSEKPYYCGICKKQFSFKSLFIRHMRTHSGEKLFYCDICKKQFPSKNHFIRHMRTHTGEKPYQCHVCKKRFAQKDYLKRHIPTHTGDMCHNDISCHCDTCNKKFSQTGRLNSHMHSSTYKKTNQSDISRNAEFKQSRDSPTGEKPHQCSMCKRSESVCPFFL